MTQIGHHNDAYRSTPLEQKLAWFQNAPGQSAVEPARQFMSGAASLYTDSDAQVRNTMRALGVDWTGDAATNAGSTLQRAADWSANTGASHGAGGETVEGYGESFESLRGKVHWDDPWAWGWNDTASAAASVATLNPAPFLGNLTADYFTTAQQNRTNDATAVAALQAHEEQTRTSVAAFPSIDPAPVPPSTDPAAQPSRSGPRQQPADTACVHGRRCGERGRAAPLLRSVQALAGAGGALGGAAAARIPFGEFRVGWGRLGRRHPGNRTGRDPGRDGRTAGSPAQAAPAARHRAVAGHGSGRSGRRRSTRRRRAGRRTPHRGPAGPSTAAWAVRLPGGATGVPGSDPRLRGGIEPPGGAVGGALRPSAR